MYERQGIIKVAVPAPLHQVYDYLPPQSHPSALRAGTRVRVPFGRTTKIGMVVDAGAGDGQAGYELKTILEVLDDRPVLPDATLKLFQWAASYYHHPLGEVIFSSLPPPLRQGARPEKMVSYRYHLTEAGLDSDPGDLSRAPKQAAMVTFLRRHPDGASEAQLLHHDARWRITVRALIDKGLIYRNKKTSPARAIKESDPDYRPFRLNPDQTGAVEAICDRLGGFAAFLLDGITGSGKTEVYLNVIDQVIAQNRQALVLIPEIGLTPQLVARFADHVRAPVAVLHSGLSDKERLHAWLLARDGEAGVVIGTRSAVFTPLLRPGICIIDEEHDPSFKQQDGFRYHARDLAVMRARQEAVPVVLGSATPSLESLHNAGQGRYRRLMLRERIGNARPPTIHLLDMRAGGHENDLSPALLKAVKTHLEQDNQVLMFLNRRGYAPTLFCPGCGWIALCPRCDAHMILHRSRHRLHCHHCDAQQAPPAQCPQCEAPDLLALGQGTERIEEALQAQFPKTEIIRIDRDSTRRKGAMQALLQRIHEGGRQILLGTQMIAKGHHLPNITLVGILNADQGLFGADFRAIERMGQLILQVAGRAGRADKPGEVYIQTHYPDHPAFRPLLSHDYQGFSRMLLEERRLAQLPPCGNLALFRAEALDQALPRRFLQALHHQATALSPEGVRLLGPVTAPMEKRAGRFRAQLLLLSTQRRALHLLLKALIPVLEGLPGARKVRWSLDVDPQEMF